jgi:hypothetical protein
MDALRPKDLAKTNNADLINALRNFAQSASNTVSENVSAPIDAIAWALRKAGMPVNKPIMGSDWMREKGLTAPVQEGVSKMAGDTLGMISPLGLTKQGAQAVIDVGGKMKNIPVGNMFIGETAKTWDEVAAAQAKMLEKQGKTPQQIWKDTGTFKGVDGKYRQEIPDTSMKLVDTLSDNLANKRNIDRYFEHKPLYEAYPDARQIKFMPTDSMSSGNADWTPSQNLIRLGQGEGFSSVTPASSTLHELQHAIQQKEGWQTGGSSLTGLNDAYRNLAGEAEARATQSRMGMDAAQRRAKFPLESYDVPIDQLIVK